MKHEPLSALRAALPGGWLLQPFNVAWYQAAVDPAYHLPDFGRAGGDALGILVANQGGVWEDFVAALGGDPRLAETLHPFEEWTEDTLRPAFESVAAGAAVAWEVRWAHEPPTRRVAMQRLADLSGLAPLSPMQLNVHAEYGPWIALRAALVLDLPGLRERPGAVVTCDHCDRACKPMFAEALAVHDLRAAGGLGAAWQRWLAVRDACPVGRAHRYGDDQIRYHYTKDRDVLRRAARRHL